MEKKDNGLSTYQQYRVINMFTKTNLNANEVNPYTFVGNTKKRPIL